MSHEFYQIMVGAPTISVHSWKQLALWSLEYSCLDDDKKAEGEKYFRTAWEQFCENVVREYGNLLDGDRINEAKANEKYA